MGFLRKKGLFETGKVLFLPVDDIRPNPGQPRTHFSPQGLEELADSIREYGILQPLSVRRSSTGYELVAGERRLRASRLVGLTQVPCILVDVDGQSSSLLALVENLQRRDLDFLEEAVALDRLISLYHLSQEEAARRIGKSQSAVANKLRLLRLSPELLAELQAAGLTERHARALLRLEDEDQRLQVLRHMIDHRLTVAKTEAYIDALLAPPPPPKRKPTILIKDVRFFLNTIYRGLSLMQTAGVQAQCGQEETEDSILLTIRIPKCG